MNRIYFLFLSCVIMGISSFGQSVPGASLKVSPSLNCDANTFKTSIQIKAFAEEIIEIGTSSIYLEYNPEAIQFKSYQGTNFNETYTCLGGVASPWAKHEYDALSIPGVFNLTLILDKDGESCKELTAEEWVEIGFLEFDVVDKNASPDLKIISNHTHLNSAEKNDGTAAIAYKRGSNLNSQLLDCAGITPLQINNFILNQLDENVKLAWEASNFQEGASFVIERSLDKRNFKVVGTITDTELASENELFEFEDANVFQSSVPKLYYRVTAVNFDGTENQSEINAIEILNADNMSIKVGPSPAQSVVHFQVSIPEQGSFNFHVLNSLGQKVYPNRQLISGAITQLEVDVTNWSEGVYFFKVEDGAHSFSKSVVVQ